MCLVTGDPLNQAWLLGLHLNQIRLNPVMVLLLGDRSRHRGTIS
jgi:hypothetical protein